MVRMRVVEKITKALKWLFNETEIVGSKNPSDYKQCKLSTGWSPDDHHCTSCMKSTEHREYMSGICNGCGSFKTQVRFERSWRKIFIDGEWKYQIKYKDGTEEIRKWWY